MKESLFVVVELNNGERESFTIPLNEKSAMVEKLRFKEFFQSNYIIFSTPDDVMLFPINSVISVKMSIFDQTGWKRDMEPYLPISTFRNANRM